MVFSELYETNEPAIKLAKDKYGFDFRDWQQFQITHKINWICNCVKHKDGFPIKQPKPIQFQDLNESERIRITPSEFKLDCSRLMSFYPLYLQAIFMFAQLKLAVEMVNGIEDQTSEFYIKQFQKLQEAESSAKTFIEALRRMP